MKTAQMFCVSLSFKGCNLKELLVKIHRADIEFILGLYLEERKGDERMFVS